MTFPVVLAESLEAISRANADLADYLSKSVETAQKAIEAAVMAERERCAKIAEIEHMTPRDIARVIRSNYPSD